MKKVLRRLNNLCEKKFLNFLFERNSENISFKNFANVLATLPGIVGELGGSKESRKRYADSVNKLIEKHKNAK